MNIPKELMYTKSHEWVKFIDESTALIGLTDYAQKSLGDIVFVNLPQVGDALAIGVSFSDVESVKSVSDVYSPLVGTVVAINTELIDAPELINENAYAAWLIKVMDITKRAELLDAQEYEQLLEEEA